VRLEDNKAGSGTKNIPPKLLEKFRTNIREGQLYECSNWDIIMEEAMSKLTVVAKREAIIN
jgi:hypothetical protein